MHVGLLTNKVKWCVIEGTEYEGRNLVLSLQEMVS
jgi:hypothetical protein